MFPFKASSPLAEPRMRDKGAFKSCEIEVKIAERSLSVSAATLRFLRFGGKRNPLQCGCYLPPEEVQSPDTIRKLPMPAGSGTGKKERTTIF